MFQSVSSFFGTVGSAVKSGWNSVFGDPSPAPEARIPYTPAKVQAPVSTSKVTSKPSSLAVNSNSIPTSSGTSVLSFMNDALGTLKSGVETFFSVKNQLNDARTATKLNEIRNDAIVQTVRQADPVAQATLPSYGDWLSNQGGAMAGLIPSLASGSGIAGGISGLAYLLGGAALVYVLVKK